MKTPQERRAQACAWNKANRDRLRIADRARYAANPEQKRASAAAWRAAHPERARAAVRAWQQANPDRVLAANQAWKAEHPEQRRAAALMNQHRRLARKRSAPRNDLTMAEWRFIRAFFGERCFYCGQKAALQIEHMTPIARGGSHTAENIVPACAPCNGAKHVKTADEFLR